ncbi:MAG TPA: DUF4131 domain-containing protein, partial [Candidatus Paceibacterota bacterium]|nr:DUF4131 domain-containing protein [Candidatus Paceibacterota bacterium]
MAARIFWAVVSGFLLGVALRSLLFAGFAYAGALTLFALCALALGFLEKEKRSVAFVCATFFFAGALGIVRMQVATLSGDPALTARLGTQITIEGVVSAEPDVRDGSVRVNIATQKIIAPIRASVHAGI